MSRVQKEMKVWTEALRNPQKDCCTGRTTRAREMLYLASQIPSAESWREDNDVRFSSMEK